MLKNTPACHFWSDVHFSVQNGEQLLNEKKYQISLTSFGEKTTEKKCAKFQDQGSSRLKVKRKSETEHRETASFMYNFVQKSNATVQL